MLSVNVKAHRKFLQAHTPQQKLYVALTIRPEGDAVGARPPLAIAFVVDTSGSMREIITTEPTRPTGETYSIDGKTYSVVIGGKSRLDVLIEGLERLLKEPNVLMPSDQIGIVKFDDRAQVLAPLTPASNVAALTAAVRRLTEFTGGTQLGAGMNQGVALLAGQEASRRMVLLSDGLTFDEAVVREVTERLSQQRIPVTVIGVGHDLNLDLLTDVANRTQGRMMDVVPDNANPQPPSIRATDLPREILADVKLSGTEVVTDVELTVTTVRDVTIDRVTRVYPLLAEVDLRERPYPLGNVAAGDDTVFIIEATLPARPPLRMRIAQLGFTYRVPGRNYRGECKPIDVVVEYVDDEEKSGRMDSGVMDFVKQRNVESLVQRAVREARTDPAAAQKTMMLARNMTQKLGNNVMTQVLDRAMGELVSSKTISLQTAKTMRIGAKTQTMRLQGGGASPEEIEELKRRVLGPRDDSSS